MSLLSHDASLWTEDYTAFKLQIGIKGRMLYFQFSRFRRAHVNEEKMKTIQETQGKLGALPLFVTGRLWLHNSIKPKQTKPITYWGKTRAETKTQRNSYSSYMAQA